MPQTDAWEREYRNPKLVTGKAEPQNDVKRYLKFLKKEEKVSFDELRVLDLGCGTGRNANYLAEMVATDTKPDMAMVTGFEISNTALKVAVDRATEAGLKVDYKMQSIGEVYPCEDTSFDLILDITSSNSLNEKEREIYLKETHRVLKNGGHFFVRALCKDGDANVKELLKRSPGKEYDTYINTEMKLTERVFTKEDFIKTYSPNFSIQKLEKKTGYAHFNGRIYKRNYWLAYMKKV
jgi:SAM-dependent methyltransferase